MKGEGKNGKEKKRVDGKEEKDKEREREKRGWRKMIEKEEMRT